MSGFHVSSILPGSGAPGSAKVIEDPHYEVNGKPVIVLSGDDDHKAYLLHAASNSVSDWSYTSDILIDMHHGTIGGISFADVNGDGNIEVFVPAYTNNSVFVYTLEP
ncbi:hypothetical protein KUTeg_006276 [Tegillarca granosa]|uniref:Uncharacterized protein n=1 Tax=Tegillarca granosa TaxID=220873 RepID=A0ABQ9FEU7_TEGGR|nr:hypothetical protein KUTeg_007980 [Tegillarca granosa]KAJ8316262.1 hypothetical protein KUTeg_006276 [Tegillarca granosa]